MLQLRINHQAESKQAISSTGLDSNRDSAHGFALVTDIALS